MQTYRLFAVAKHCSTQSLKLALFAATIMPCLSGCGAIDNADDYSVYSLQRRIAAMGPSNPQTKTLGSTVVLSYQAIQYDCPVGDINGFVPINLAMNVGALNTVIKISDVGLVFDSKRTDSCEAVQNFSISLSNGSIFLAKLESVQCSTACGSCPGQANLNQQVVFAKTIDAKTNQLYLKIPNTGVLNAPGSNAIPSCSSGSRPVITAKAL